MSATPERKNLVLEVKDAEKGLVEAVFATLHVKDHDGDITLPGAFGSGKRVALSSYGHNAVFGAPPAGKGTIREDGDHVVFEGKFNLKTAAGRESFEAVKDMEDLQEWSYAFNIVETGEVTEEMRQQGVRRVLKKVDVFEVSPVLRGAGVGTETLAVKERDRLDDPTPADPASRAEFVRFMRTRQRLARIA